MKKILFSVVCAFLLSGGVSVLAETTDVKKDDYPLTTCIVSGQELGSMGDAIEYDHEGTLVKFCCAGCVDVFKEDPVKYLEILEIAKAAQAVEAGEEQDEAAAEKAEGNHDAHDGHDHTGHNH